MTIKHAWPAVLALAGAVALSTAAGDSRWDKLRNPPPPRLTVTGPSGPAVHFAADDPAAPTLPPAVRNQVVSAVVPETISDILKALKFGAEPARRADGPPAFVVALGGYKAALLLNDKNKDGRSYGSLQLYATFKTATKPGYLTLNTWNGTRRFCRAWVDETTNEACLAADLDLDGGVTKGSIEQFLYVFAAGMRQFGDYLEPKAVP